MPEKSPAWMLHALLRTGADYWTLLRELVSVLLRRDMSADSGLLCHAKTVEECKIVVSASWMDSIYCAYRHNSVKGEFSGASPLTIRHEPRQLTHILRAPRPAASGRRQCVTNAGWLSYIPWAPRPVMHRWIKENIAALARERPWLPQGVVLRAAN